MAAPRHVSVVTTPWAPRLAFAMYAKLVRAAAFAPEDAQGGGVDDDGTCDADECAWAPEATFERLEALELLKCVWVALGINPHAHAVAELQVSYAVYSHTMPRGVEAEPYLTGLVASLRTALGSKAPPRDAGHTEVRIDAVREAAAKLSRLGGGGARRRRARARVQTRARTRTSRRQRRGRRTSIRPRWRRH